MEILAFTYGRKLCFPIVCFPVTSLEGDICRCSLRITTQWSKRRTDFLTRSKTNFVLQSRIEASLPPMSKCVVNTTCLGLREAALGLTLLCGVLSCWDHQGFERTVTVGRLSFASESASAGSCMLAGDRQSCAHHRQHEIHTHIKSSHLF